MPSKFGRLGGKLHKEIIGKKNKPKIIIKL